MQSLYVFQSVVAVSHYENFSSGQFLKSFQAKFFASVMVKALVLSTMYEKAKSLLIFLQIPQLIWVKFSSCCNLPVCWNSYFYLKNPKKLNKWNQLIIGMSLDTSINCFQSLFDDGHECFPHWYQSEWLWLLPICSHFVVKLHEEVQTAQMTCRGSVNSVFEYNALLVQSDKLRQYRRPHIGQAC